MDVDPGDRRRQPAVLPFPCDRLFLRDERHFSGFRRDLHFHLDRAESGNEIREIIAVGEGQVAPVEQVKARPSVFRRAESDIDGRRAVHKDRRLRKQVFDHSADELPNIRMMALEEDIRQGSIDSPDFSLAVTHDCRGRFRVLAHVASRMPESRGLGRQGRDLLPDPADAYGP